MPAASTYRVKVPARTKGKSLAKATTETGLIKAYRKVRASYPRETIRIVAPGGRKRNIDPGSNIDAELMGR